MKSVQVFDLDGTLIDSRHRTPNNPDGTLNLRGYFESKSRENIFKDTLLPLANLARKMYDSGHYIVLCTARDMNNDDYDFLNHHGIKSHAIRSRDQLRCKTQNSMSSMEIFTAMQNKTLTVKKPYTYSDGAYKRWQLAAFDRLKQFATLPKVIYDDALPVLQAFISMPNWTVINAVLANEELASTI
jgi:phosphoglycolate phosphatase-like HAD superfamily hydrolase